jgi:hypothetical protein
VTRRACWRDLQGIAGQHGGFRTQVGGSVSHGDAVAVRKSPIRDDKSILSLNQPTLGLCHGDGEIDNISV